MGCTAAVASNGHGHHDKLYVCHPTNGKGSLGNGWNLIRPAQASKHIIESRYPDGHYWKHTAKDGRHDVYAVGKTCPGGETTPTSTPTPTPTETPTSTPTPTSTSTPTDTPTPTSTGCPPIPEFNRIFGTHHDDVLRGTICRDIILGHGGNDRLFAVGSGDSLLGGRGNDVLHTGADHTTLRGGMGRDICFVNPGDLVISCEVIR
jgi:Ca2+-binding RTX toxin-like protein